MEHHNQDDAAAKETGISCPKCGCRHFIVSYGRDVAGGKDRVKRCRHCRTRILTVEVLKRALPPTKGDAKSFDISNYLPRRQASCG